MKATCEFKGAIGLCNQPSAEEIEMTVPEGEKRTPTAKKFAFCKVHAANAKAQLKEHADLGPCGRLNANDSEWNYPKRKLSSPLTLPW